MTVKAEQWRDRLEAAQKRGKFSPDDINRAVLAGRGPAEELQREYDLPSKIGDYQDLVTVFRVGGRQLILDGAGFARAVRTQDVSTAEAILAQMEQQVEEYLKERE